MFADYADYPECLIPENATTFITCLMQRAFQ